MPALGLSHRELEARPKCPSPCFLVKHGHRPCLTQMSIVNELASDAHSQVPRLALISIVSPFNLSQMWPVDFFLSPCQSISVVLPSFLRLSLGWLLSRPKCPMSIPMFSYRDTFNVIHQNSFFLISLYFCPLNWSNVSSLSILRFST